MLDPNIKNIIFDLGGVIINLSVETTLVQFAKLAGVPVSKVKDLHSVHPGFLTYEKGVISDAEFRKGLNDIFGTKATDADLDACWNAMLGDIPKERIELLKELKSKYRTFLLSNTNAIHLDAFTGIVRKAHNLESLEPLFHKTYYSHQMQMRKPDAEIYEFVLNDNNLNAEETIFLDDNVANLKGAESVGIRTFHVAHPDLIFSLFR